MKKKLILFSVVAIMAITLMAIFSIGIAAENTTPELSIDYCNLSYRDTVCIKYAVSSNVDDVKVLIWTEPQTEYTAGTEDATLSTVGSEVIEGVSYKIFDYTKLAAKQMTDVIYARAYTESNGTAYYSEVNKYSVLQYAYNMLGKTAAGSDEADLKALLTDMLTYGASAQKYFGYKTDRLANAEFYQVKVAGGTLEDGSRHGLYLPGDTVTMTAPVTNSEGGTFAYWADSNGNKVGTDNSYSVTVSKKDHVYTAVYASMNLKFVSYGDGTCYVDGIGTCTDSDVIIPNVSPQGDKVITIPSYAFFGCDSIVSVEIPDSVTKIGSEAFLECQNLTKICIPSSVISIGGMLYSECKMMQAVVVDENNTKYKSIDGNLYNKDVTKLINYAVGKKDTEFSIPSSVTTISEGAFWKARNLTSIIIPNSVTTIEGGAFAYCCGLVSIEIPNSVTSIEYFTFSECTSLKEVIIPNSVTEIGGCAFECCSSLTNVIIPASVGLVNEEAFNECSGLTSISILNPNCEIYGIFGYKEIDVRDITIYGYAGSTAQEFAEEENCLFIEIVN